MSLKFKARQLLIAVILGSTLAFNCQAQVGAHPVAGGSTVLRATLTNGLRVVIVRNTLAPVVATSVNYMVGSEETPAGFPGTAHAQEHMMFRGSPGLSADQLANIGSIMGGDFNANTRESLTQYLYTVPSEDLDVALHIEALRMAGVTDAQSEWDHERGAIEQEVAQDLSNPGYVLYSKLRGIAFKGTPYAFDALGTRPSFEKTTAAMLKQFHDQWYAPNNALLIIVGDVDPAATLSQVKQLFGAIPRKTLPARKPVDLQPLKATSFAVDTDRPEGTQMIAFRVPGLDSKDIPALEVLSDVLSSRRFDLYGLVPQGKALGAEFSIDPLPKAGLAFATVSFPGGTDPKALEQEVRAILARVAREGVPADLVAAAKLQERRQTEFQKNSIEGLASVWADALALYGLESPEQDLTRIEKVTVADVNRVAHEYLKLDEAVSAVMLPKGSGGPVSGGGSGFGGQENIALGEAKPTPLPDWAKSAVNRLTIPAVTTHPVVTHLPNGITLVVQPEDVSDTVSVIGHIRNRPEVQAPKGEEGIANLLGELLSYGSQHLDRLAYQGALDAIGAEAHAGTDFAVETLTGGFDRGVELLADNELHPALPARALEIMRPQFEQIIASRNHSPGYLMQRSLRGALFPATDPSQRETTPASIKGITIEQVRAYQAATFRPDLTTIVVIGRVTPEQARATIEKYFGAWTATGPKPDTDLPAVPPNGAATIAVPDASRVQDFVMLAQSIPLTRSNPDYYALQLGSAVLGGGFYSSRLSIHLRKEAGLVYSVGSNLQIGRTRGIYMIDFASDPQNVGKAAAMALQDVKGLQNQPPGDEELLRTKALLLRQIPLSEASIDEIARGFIDRDDLGLPLDEPTVAARRYIELKPQDVQNVFKKWIRPGDFVRVSQGPTPP
ncbi:MAG TPA: pitrilysin family protein [Steroidobacteraceae bacterium]|nr:pitrilysin family protein [Steroidobacteraceae bacterium]